MPRSTVTVHGPPARLADFERVFGSATVPVTQLLPVPAMAELPGVGRKPVYLLDLRAIDQEQRARLIDFCVERFGENRRYVIDHLDELGFPILAEDCTFTTDALEFL